MRSPIFKSRRPAAAVRLSLILAATAFSMVTCIDWKDGSNNVKWGMDCDFYGNDIAKIDGPGENCGGNCAGNSQCTHFTWYYGTCYLKRFDFPATAKSLQGGVCGWVNRGPSPTPGTVELTVQNNCPYTTWMAQTSNTGYGPLPGGTVRIDRGQRYVYKIPTAGWAGRLWPKVDCDSSGTNCGFGDSSPPCPAGGCQPPADTKIEFNIPPQPATTDSWYDISLVDGYSLPMKIVPRGVNSGACIPTTCSLSLAACPQNEVQGIGDLRIIRNGKVVACLSPCKKWNFPAPYGWGRNEQISPGVNMCCPTPPISPQACSSGPVITTQFVKTVRSACPTAYSYAYDDLGGLHNCPGSTSFDVTLCP